MRVELIMNGFADRRLNPLATQTQFQDLGALTGVAPASA